MAKDIFSPEVTEKKVSFRRDRKLQWVEDAYIAQGEEGTYLSSNFNFSKLRVILWLILIVFLVLIGRTGQLQIVKGGEYRQAAEENRIRIKDIKSPRGIIYDQNGSILVRNIPNFILQFTPADLPQDDSIKNELLTKISEVLKIDPSSLQNTINEEPSDSFESFTLYDHIPYDQAIPLRIITSSASGFTLETGTFREYVDDKNLSVVLGYLGKISLEQWQTLTNYAFDDYIGKSGVELSYETVLKGVNGKKEIEVDSFGKESKIISEQKPQSGKNITLTIDKELQDTLGDALEKTVSGSKNITGGAAVAIDVNSGEILALVSSPTYDLNKLTLGLSQEEYDLLDNNPKKPFVNRAISGEYPSGSTIKPLISLAALQEGVITPATTVMSTGGIRIDKWFFPDWKTGGHGLTDLRKALAESVNTFFYMAGGGYEDKVGLGIDRITSYLKLFGLGSTLGINIPGEASGFLPSKAWKESAKGEAWYIGDTYHLAIGQGDLLVTPLQVATYTATVANGGTFYKPHLVKSIFTTEQDATIIEPEIIRSNFINSAHYNVVREGLRQGVTSGSSRALADLPFTSAGKTGTAQFGDNKSHAWFTSFAPYENPQIAITVLVEGGGEGNVTALPIAKLGLQNWFSRHPYK